MPKKEKDKKPKKDKPKITTYQGNKVITLNPTSKFTFTFGVAKAKLILKHMKSIKKFVKKYGGD